VRYNETNSPVAEVSQSGRLALLRVQCPHVALLWLSGRAGAILKWKSGDKKSCRIPGSDMTWLETHKLDTITCTADQILIFPQI
jgi:hypothetical protein